MSRRTERLGSAIQHELAQIIMRDLSDPRLTGMPSITRVKVSADLSIADVYVTIMGSEGQQSASLNALRHSAGLMRTRLTKALTLRVAPFLKFHIDESLKREIVVLDLLRQVAEENAELDRKRAAAAAPQTALHSGDEPAGMPAPETAAAAHTETSQKAGADPAANQTTNQNIDRSADQGADQVQ